MHFVSIAFILATTASTTTTAPSSVWTSNDYMVSSSNGVDDSSRSGMKSIPSFIVD